MSPTYLFYDIESSGLNKCFDQVLQFAAIRTDMAFNELERHEFFVKLNPDTIPSPGASITHHISIEQANTGFSELEAIQKIHELLNVPGTISLGYNTLTFDDEFLRFSFWRNLLTPYTHQYANGCSRMDLYPITVLYYLFKPDVLQWPEKDGKLSMKLENISALNELASGPAHNALVDVEATVALAKKLAAAPEMWQYCLGYFSKPIEQKRLSQLPIVLETNGLTMPQGLMVMGKFGNRDQFQAPVLGLGQHYHYKNQTLWLRLDLPELQKTTLENMGDKDSPLWVVHKKYGEPGLILPPKERFEMHLSTERKQIVIENLIWCRANAALMQAISHYYCDYQYPVVPDTDVDAALYQADFMSPQEQDLSRQFHRAGLREKSHIIGSFSSPDYREMGLRIIGRNMPDGLTDKQQSLFASYLEQVYTQETQTALQDYRGEKRLTIPEAQHAIQVIRKERSLSQEQEALLKELEDYYEQVTHKALIQKAI